VKAKELRELVPQELDAKVGQLRNELFQLQLKHRTGQLENPVNVRKAKRALARALTVQGERRRAS
jgi:large subunit ribosomal protein L29